MQKDAVKPEMVAAIGGPRTAAPNGCAKALLRAEVPRRLVAWPVA